MEELYCLTIFFLCPLLIDDVIKPTYPKSIKTNLDWANQAKEVT
jgi:hypothetical protein